MMHGIVSSCYCLKWATHNMSVTLQAVQTERRRHMNESAFHVPLHTLSDFPMSYPNLMSSNQRTVVSKFPSCVS